ncbi:MAG: tryptophan-rich sensory protein [Alphaproteobacteria bacterium]|nr:tryptophan-rich sensory protein [Alphaproteobacteria bacterium]
MKRLIQLCVAMIISFLPGIFGVFFSPHGDSDLWYMALNKSGLTPPGVVFGAAWTILYALLGFALFLVIKSARGKAEKFFAYVLFFAQMLLNAGWVYLFFGLHMTAFALVVLLALFIISIWMARVFDGIDRKAMLLIIPYLLWMMFAFYLNAYIVLMN